MPINTNIAMGYRGVEIPQQNALADYAAIQQIQGGRQAQELNALKMQEAQAAMQERNALRQLNPAAADYESQLFKVSPQLGIQYRKEQTAAETAKLGQQESAFKLQKAKKDFVAQAQRDTSQNPSDANITAYMEDLVANPLFTESEKQQMTAGASRLLSMPVEQRRSFMSSQGASASELKPVTSVGPTGIVQTPAFGGAATVVPGTGAAFQMTPAQIAQNRIAQGQLNVAQQRLAQEGQGVTYQQDAQGNLMALPSRLSAGAVPTARPVTGEGGVAVKGKPSAFAEKAAAQKAQMGKDINQAIFELKSVVKPGGLIDQSTGSGAGRLYDIGAGFVGQAPEGAIAAGQLEPIADLVLKMVPRFEGPQSDKDTQSYKAAAGQLANSSLPTKIRKAAANEIIRLMEARKTQFGSVDADAPAANVIVNPQFPGFSIGKP